MDIAPDAASLISQGDTIVFETNGMPELLSQRMLDIQQELRDKFKRVQTYRYGFSVVPEYLLIRHINHTFGVFRRSGSDKPTRNDFREREKELNRNLDEIEGIIEKVLKQTKELLGQTWNDSSVEELSNRITDIKVKALLYISISFTGIWQANCSFDLGMLIIKERCCQYFAMFNSFVLCI